jgi:hypothetical protein
MIFYRVALTRRDADGFEKLYATVAALIIEAFGPWTGNRDKMVAAYRQPMYSAGSTVHLLSAQPMRNSR